jgi:hypothetical protein
MSGVNSSYELTKMDFSFKEHFDTIRESQTSSINPLAILNYNIKTQINSNNHAVVSQVDIRGISGGDIVISQNSSSSVVTTPTGSSSTSQSSTSVTISYEEPITITDLSLTQHFLSAIIYPGTNVTFIFDDNSKTVKTNSTNKNITVSSNDIGSNISQIVISKNENFRSLGISNDGENWHAMLFLLLVLVTIYCII